MLKYQTQAQPQMPITIFSPLEVRMEVVFGTPSQNCIGSGVCMVMHQLPQRYPLYCPHAPALISYQDGLLLFRFLKMDMQRADAAARFRGPWFEVNEEFRMPRSTARRLGMPTEWVRPGAYPIEGNAKEWQLRFDLYEANGLRVPMVRAL
jgi:hypothetical protein